MDVLMPDGTTITGVPEGTTQTELLARYGKYTAAKTAAPEPGLPSITPQAAPVEAAAPVAPATPMAPNVMDAQAYKAALEQRNQQTPERSVSDIVLDTGITFLKGTIGLPESFVGLADIPTKGAIGKLLEGAGYKPKEASAILDTYLSEAQQAANRKVSEAKGFVPTVQAALQNPSTIATSIGESVPQMIGGAGVARGILKAAPILGPVIAGGLGEGVLGAGSAAEDIRAQNANKLLTPEQATAAAGSGIGTALFGIAGGRLAQKLGLDDIQTMLAAGSSLGPAKSVVDFGRRAIGSGITEGIFQEMPQSGQEKMWMNYATNRPLLEGVPEAMGMGAVTGFGMGVLGGGAGASSQEPQGIKQLVEKAEPTEPTAPPPAAPSTELAAQTLPTSESQDYEDMLAELEQQMEGKPEAKAPEVVNVPPEPAEEVVNVPVEEAAKPAETIAEAPKPEQSPELQAAREDFSKAAKGISAAKQKRRNGEITQEQFDSLQAQFDERKARFDDLLEKEVGAKSPFYQEAMDIGNKMIATQDTRAKGFGQGVISAARAGQLDEERMKFYRESLNDFEQRAPEAAGKSTIKETRGLSEFIATGNKGEVARYEYLKKHPEYRNILAKADLAMQSVTDEANQLGFRINDINPTSPQQLQEVHRKASVLAGAVTRYMLEAERVAKKQKTASQEKLDNAAAGLEKDIQDAIKPVAPVAPAVTAAESSATKAELEKATTEAHEKVNKAVKEYNKIYATHQKNRTDENLKKLYEASIKYNEANIFYDEVSLTEAQYQHSVGDLDDSQFETFTENNKNSTGSYKKNIATANKELEELSKKPSVEKAKPKTALEKASPLRMAAYKKNPFLTFLAEKGLYHEKGKPGSQMIEFNAGKQIMVSGYGPVFKKSGMLPDDLVVRAIEDGYLPQDATESDVVRLIELALSGKKVEPTFSEQGQEDMAARYAERAAEEADSYEERTDQTDAEWYGMSEEKYTELMAQELAAVNDKDFADLDDAINELMETPSSTMTERAAMEALGFTEEEIQNEERKATAKAGEAAPKEEAPSTTQGEAAPELELQQQTAQELKDKQDEIDRLNKENERLAKQAEAKAKADAERGEFVLTGSNRPADEAAARGQQDIFGAIEEEPAKPKMTEKEILARMRELTREEMRDTEESPARDKEQADLAKQLKELKAAEAPKEEAPAEEAAAEPELSKEYQVVLDESRDAYKEFAKAQEAYRAQTINDDEFIAARKKYDVVMAKYDKAYEKERERMVADEVVGPEETPPFPRLTREPYTFEGQFTEKGEEEQLKILAGPIEKLNKDQVNTLENHYGVKSGSIEFVNAVRQDVIDFVVKGAKAVNGKIRAIIRALAHGVLATSLVFNPQFISHAYTVSIPQYDVSQREVLEQVPENVRNDMSQAAQRAYAVIYPTLKSQLKANNKFFIVADKQTATTFIFNPDGTPFLHDKTLFGAAIGDFIKGDAEIQANRITAAGLFDLGMRDAKRSAEEAYSYGDYDFGKVFVLDKSYMGSHGPYSQLVMHSVWTHEKDAKQRLAALEKPGAEDSRYSFGCINVKKEVFGKLIAENLQQMDGAKIFIVPENGSNVMDFINGKATYSPDIIRQRVVPLTEEVKTEKQRAEQRATPKVYGREEEGPNYYNIQPIKETPKLTVDVPNENWLQGKIDYAIEKGRNKNGVPHMSTVTGRFDKPVEVSLRVLSKLKGESGEQNNVRQDSLNYIRKNWDEVSKQPPYIEVAYNGEAFVSEGNHRIMVALEKGLDTMPVEIRYFDGGERRNGPLNPNRIPSLDITNQNIEQKPTDWDYIPEIQEEVKRSPSLKRRLDKLNRDREAGKITDEKFIEEVDAALEQAENARYDKMPKGRVRGYRRIKEVLNKAVRNGDISAEGSDMAEWFMGQNPDLVNDLGISVRAPKEGGVGGFYSQLSRIMTLIKGGQGNETIVHEILHHLERMMPADIQNAIRKAWGKQLLAAQKKAKTPAEKLYFAALIEAHYGNNDHDFIDVAKGDMSVVYAKALSYIAYESPGNKSSLKLAQVLLKMGDVSYEMYQYYNPSEFWAVNGTRIVEGRYDAVKGGVLAKLKNWLRELGQKIKGVFGFNSDAPIIRALNSLSKADGNFVSKDMLTQGFLHENIRRNYLGDPAPASTWDSPEESKMKTVEYKLVDKQVDLKDVIKSIKETVGEISDKWNAYIKEELFHGRTAKAVQDFLNKELLPVLEELKDNNITLAELDEYLHNRHAEERNEQISKVNPKYSNTSAETSGSGISSEAAAKYLAGLSDERRAAFESLAAKVDAIISKTQDMLVEGGLEKQDVIDSWNQAYEHYVPLQRADLDFVHHGTGLGSGYGTKGGASKRATGSLKKVVDIFANIALQRERAIIRSEKARVGRALYGLAIQNPNPNFWLPVNPDAVKDPEKLAQELIDLGLNPEDANNVLQEPKVAGFNKKTGLVQYQVNPVMRNSDNVFPVRINGEDRFIFFNPSDPRALRMVESLKNLDAEQLGLVLGTIGEVTRWIASVNTQYNPVFGAWNFARDVSGAAFNLTTTPIADRKAEVLSGVFPALRGIYSELRAGRKKTTLDTEYAKLFEQFQKAGGQTGYKEQFSKGKDKANIVERELERLDHGNVRKAAAAVFNWLSDYNDAMENAVRLSAFKVALDAGLTEERAASIAKNLTVNFNRKGAASPILQSLYAFFNAAVQGTVRVGQTLSGPAGKKIMAGGIAVGVFQALALAMAGYDDDDPPEYLKNKNLILPVPGGNYLIVPMPIGFNIFPGIGRLMTEYVLGQSGMISGAKSAGSKIVSATSLILDAFNPLGSGSLIQVLAPTIVDPVAAIQTNRDAFGRPISKEDRATNPTPGYTRSRENASAFSQALAEFLNYVSSPMGTKYTKGAISPTADQLDYLIGQYTGGVGREVMKTAEYVKSKVTGEEVPSYRVPIVGKLYGETESPAAISAKFYDNVTRMAEHENEIKSLIKNKEKTTEYKAEHPEWKFYNRANYLENQITQINHQKKLLRERDAPEERIKRLDERKTALMKKFNDQVRAAQ
jgi:hypothetical protein